MEEQKHALTFSRRGSLLCELSRLLVLLEQAALSLLGTFAYTVVVDLFVNATLCF